LVGTLLLLGNLGIVTINLWSAVLAISLIVFGAGLLWTVIVGPAGSEGEHVAIPLGDIIGARIRVQHGAGRLRVDGSASAGMLLEGTFASGLDYRKQRLGDEVQLELSPGGIPGLFAPWNWGSEGIGWDFGLNPEIPITLKVETGASEARLNLRDLRVTDLRLETGASSVEVILPAQAGHSRARVQAGAAAISFRVPEGVAASIRFQGALASVDVDQHRFPRSGDVYRSPDYERAEHRVDLEVEAGVGSLTVR
jgi:hypothetical protein